MPGNKRIFVAAWEYPPFASGESIVCQRTLQYSKYDYDVCCGSGPQSESESDEHICTFPVGGNKYLQWPFSAVKKFQQLDARQHYQVMMSRVMPPNGHLAGWLIKRLKPDIKWIAYFSDPVWNSPFLKLTLRKNNEQRPKWLLMKLFGWPAKWAVQESDLLVFNNDRLARYVLGDKYELYKNKMVIAPYGHTGFRPRVHTLSTSDTFCLVHVGQFYGMRTLRDLIDGLELLRERKPDIYERLLVRQVGFCSKQEQLRVANSSVADKFEFVEPVPYAQSIEEMYKADCLLVVDPVFDNKSKNIYIPGKLFDYISTGRPIMCIADSDSATGDMAREMKCLCVPPQAEAVCDALIEISQKLIVPQNLDKFHCRVGVEELDKAIDWVWSGEY